MTTATTPPRFSLLLIMAITSVIPLNMFVPSMPKIADDFGVDYGVVNIAIGGFAIVSALTQVVGGALSDRYGRRPVALGSLGIFTIASIGCILAPNVQVFLGFRMLQGVIAACLAVALAAIRDSWAGPEMRARIGNLSSAWAIGPMLGPTVGGVLASAFGWRSNFVLFALLGAFGFTMVYVTFAETNTERSLRLLQLDYYGRIVRSRLFWAYSSVMAFSMGTLFIFLGGAPAVAQEMGNLSSSAIGIFIGLVPAGFMLGSAITARTSSHVPAHHLILAGRSLTVAGTVTALALLYAGVDHPLAFFLPCVTIGMGNGLTLPSSNAGVLTIAGKNAGAALGLASAITISGAALLSFVSGFVIQDGNARQSTLLFMLVVAAAALVVALLIFRAMQWSQRQDDLRPE